MPKEKMVIDYNDKLDTVWITVDRKTTPRLFESRVNYIMRTLNMSREEAEKFCDERAGWKIPLSLLMEDNTVFALELEALYSEDMKNRAPYSGRPIVITYDGIVRNY